MCIRDRIKSEEELMVMILEMEGRIDRLVTAIKGEGA